MAIRGATFGSFFMAIAVAVVFTLLTLLPWWLAIGLVVLAIALVFLNVHLKGERHARKISRAEANAELQRELIRASADRSEVLRCRGGGAPLMAGYQHGREPFSTSQNSARDVGPSGRMTNTEVAVPAPNTLRETTDAELLEAAERMDGGLRLAVPMLFDDTERLSAEAVAGRTEHLRIADAPLTVVGEGEPEIDDELIGRMADSVAEFRDEAFRELRHLDKHAPRHIHIEALALVAQCDEFLATVGDYFRGQS
jgi:uncharacterized membrane protein YciS (DUF1049 family)